MKEKIRIIKEYYTDEWDEIAREDPHAEGSMTPADVGTAALRGLDPEDQLPLPSEFPELTTGPRRTGHPDDDWTSAPDQHLDPKAGRPDWSTKDFPIESSVNYLDPDQDLRGAPKPPPLPKDWREIKRDDPRYALRLAHRNWRAQNRGKKHTPRKFLDDVKATTRRLVGDEAAAPRMPADLPSINLPAVEPSRRALQDLVGVGGSPGPLTVDQILDLSRLRNTRREEPMLQEDEEKLDILRNIIKETLTNALDNMKEKKDPKAGFVPIIGVGEEPKDQNIGDDSEKESGKESEKEKGDAETGDAQTLEEEHNEDSLYEDVWGADVDPQKHADVDPQKDAWADVDPQKDASADVDPQKDAYEDSLFEEGGDETLEEWKNRTMFEGLLKRFNIKK